MVGFLRASSHRGIGMIVLQILRVATVITLLTAAAASWILIIKVDTGKPYFIFECFSLFFTSIFCSLLVVSELAFADFIKIWLRGTWPVLSDHFGLGWLGAGMIIVGCNILGSLNQPDDEDGDKQLSSAFSSLVLAAGILAFIFGVLNIVCALIWCDSKEGITSRDIRAHGSLAQSQRDDDLPGYESGSLASSVRNEKTRSKFVSLFWKKDNDAQNTSRPNISGPIVINHTHDRDVESQGGDRHSPMLPGLKRPDTALHPMHTRRSSRYSEADMSRF